MARGYPDYQRVENWDGPGVVSVFKELVVGTLTSGIEECSRYGYLTGCIGVGKAPVSLFIEYFLDAAGAQPIGTRKLVLDPSVTGTGQVGIPNLGPFVRVQVIPLTGGTTWEGFIRLFLSNRTSVTELRLATPILCEGSHVFGAAENVIAASAGYFAGPAKVRFTNSGAIVAFIQTEAATALGTWAITDRTQLAAAGEKSDVHIIAATAVRFTISTAAGGTTCTWCVTASSSGSS